MNTQQIISLVVGIAGFIIAIYKLIEEKIFGIKVFEERKKAQRRMVMDMVKSSELNYVGITHEKMVSYFEDAFEQENEPKWQVINFFFPVSEYGRCWDVDFDYKMSLSILKISDYLMNKKAGCLKELQHVNFYLNSCSFNIGGSLFKYINSKQRYSIIYDVMQVKGNEREQDKANTIRLTHRRYKPFFKRFTGMMEEIKKSAKLLYTINVADKDLWNQSASDWDEYEQYDISPHSKSMEYMLNEINVNNCINVLSLGAGTGNMEKLLLANKMYKGFLGLVD